MTAKRPPLDYLPDVPMAKPALSIGQRLLLAAFILFPVVLFLLYFLAAMVGG